MISLFWPSYKRLKLSGIRQANGHSYCFPQEIQKALQDDWGPVYSDKPFDTDAANKFLRLYRDRNQHLFEISELGLPD